ncbi:MAG: hypothetical protein IJJ99_00735 [Oscillospiraceae bacterium]|nr:hypothetical protein [Oscillospiraceae bacterium]
MKRSSDETVEKSAQTENDNALLRRSMPYSQKKTLILKILENHQKEETVYA